VARDSLAHEPLVPHCDLYPVLLWLERSEI